MLIRASNSCWIKPKLHVGQAEIKFALKKAFWASVGLQLFLPHDNILYVFCNACITADVDVIHLTPTCIQDLKILELVDLQQLISSSYSVIRDVLPRQKMHPGVIWLNSPPSQMYLVQGNHNRIHDKVKPWIQYGKSGCSTQWRMNQKMFDFLVLKWPGSSA